MNSARSCARKAGVRGPLAPRRQGLVDDEAELSGNADECIPVGGMQPAAAEIEGDVGGGLHGVGAAAEPVAGFQHEDREAGSLQRAGGAEAGGAGADDRDVDVGGESHVRDLEELDGPDKGGMQERPHVRWTQCLAPSPEIAARSSGLSPQGGER